LTTFSRAIKVWFLSGRRKFLALTTAFLLDISENDNCSKCHILSGHRTIILSRNLTKPQIVLIICSYLSGLSLNLSCATRNIFNERIKCSTTIRLQANALFLNLSSGLNSLCLGFFCGVVIHFPLETFAGGQMLIVVHQKSFYHW
jgi:hypothetical protein